MTSLAGAAAGGRPGTRGRVIGFAAALLAWGAIMLVAAIAGLQGGALGQGGARGDAVGAAPSIMAIRDIPPDYLRLYEQAGQRFGVDWAILAAIGKLECDHGRDPDPSCRVAGAVNTAGAGGPMQFISSTWARYGVDGDGDGRADRWDVADAIYSAANYLRAAGAPRDERAAIFAYNHAQWYVAEVERWSGLYRGPPQGATAGAGAGHPKVPTRACSRAPPRGSS